MRIVVHKPRGRCEEHGDWELFEDECFQCKAGTMPDVDITCPFCGREDFDKLGLKMHLAQCEAFDAIKPIAR